MTTVTLEQIHSDIAELKESMKFIAELMIEDHEDSVANKRLRDIKEGKIEGRTEKELDNYLEKRGVQLD